jgi:hypothetical protein
MNDRSDNRGRAKSALKRNFLDTAHKTSNVDHRGYVDWPQENLLSGVRLEQFERDLREGDGNELRMKFCAIHSSAALAVNCFAPFKDRKEDLLLLDEQGTLEIQFEKQMPIICGRRLQFRNAATQPTSLCCLSLLGAAELGGHCRVQTAPNRGGGPREQSCWLCGQIPMDELHRIVAAVDGHAAAI